MFNLPLVQVTASRDVYMRRWWLLPCCFLLVFPSFHLAVWPGFSPFPIPCERRQHFSLNLLIIPGPSCPHLHSSFFSRFPPTSPFLLPSAADHSFTSFCYLYFPVLSLSSLFWTPLFLFPTTHIIRGFSLSSLFWRPSPYPLSILRKLLRSLLFLPSSGDPFSTSFPHWNCTDLFFSSLMKHNPHILPSNQHQAINNSLLHLQAHLRKWQTIHFSSVNFYTLCCNFISVPFIIHDWSPNTLYLVWTNYICMGAAQLENYHHLLLTGQSHSPRLSTAQYRLSVQNRGLKHHALHFIYLPVIFINK